MSYSLHIWERPGGLPEPASLQQAGEQMLALERLARLVNPKFVALGCAMAEHFPVCEPGDAPDDAIWPCDPAAEAATVTQAVWAVGIPDEHRVQVAHWVVQQATALGLTVLDDQLGMAFLPGGQVLPVEKAPLWAGLTRDLAAQGKPFTKADFRKMMVLFLKETLEPFGFVVDKPPTWAIAAVFTRRLPDGYQQVNLQVDGWAPEYESVIYCKHRSNRVEAPFEAVFSGQYGESEWTLWFSLGDFEGKYNRLAAKGSADIRRWMSVLRDRALPVLDMAQTLQGLDQVMNTADLIPFPPDPHRPQIRQSMDRHVKRKGLKAVFKPLIVAWMVKNPRLDAMVAEWREIIRPRVDAHDADLDRLLAYLREHVPQGR